jgi:hypothetical protein
MQLKCIDFLPDHSHIHLPFKKGTYFLIKHSHYKPKTVHLQCNFKIDGQEDRINILCL